MSDETREEILRIARQLARLLGPQFVGKLEINIRLGGEPKVNLLRSLN